jgi:hypothetical protein
MLDGPATRPTIPLAVENSVGKPAATREGVRLMSAREREHGELPSPNNKKTGNIQNQIKKWNEKE